jgi:nitrogen fixation protein NifU and related proteins
MSTADIYRELILDYYRSPRNFGRLERFDIDARDTNPLCGDEIEMQIRVGGAKNIDEIKFIGKGCAISQASASMLTELAKGKPLEWVKQVSKEDVFKLLGNPELGPSRVKCALLGMKVLKTGVYGYLGSHYDDPEPS